jgi:sec-independent protein translocase protein TatB
MFDSIGFQELMLVGLIALLVVGPKDLPLLMRRAGQFVNKLRGMAADFRANFDELARQAELDELRKEVEALRNNQPIRDIQEEFSKPFDLGVDVNAPITPWHEPENADHAPVPTGVDPHPVTPAGQTVAEEPPEAPAPKARKPRARKTAQETPA